MEKQKRLRKLWSVVLTLTLVLISINFAPQMSVKAAEIDGSGTTGDCSWSYSKSTHILTISGTGKMADYKETGNVPYWIGASQIYSYAKGIDIKSGVQYIGSYSFDAFVTSSDKTVVIPNTVTSIGAGAFYGSSGYNYRATIIIPSSVVSIGDQAFFRAGHNPSTLYNNSSINLVQNKHYDKATIYVPLNVTTDGHCSCTPSGTTSNGSYQAGTTTTLTLSPNAGYMVSGVKVNGIAATVSGNSCTFSTPTCATKIDVTTVIVDSIPPTITGGNSQRTSTKTATVKFTSSEKGQYYYSVVEDGASKPTIDTSLIGTECIEGENTITLSNLTAGAKDIYIVGKDEAGNLSDYIKMDIDYDITKLHQVIYNGDGKTSGTVPMDNTNYEEGDVVTVSKEENIIKNGYIFDGWNTKQDGKGTLYKPGETFIMGASNVTLYAQWREGTRYEAENATIIGAKKEPDVEGASGKSQVGSINDIGRYVEFPNIPAYSKVLVHYASGVSGNISVYLDNNKINRLSFASTGAWSGVGKYKDLNFALNSPKGGALKFQFDKGDGALNIDYIEIVKNPEFNSIIEVNTENAEKGTVNVKNAEVLGENKYKAKDGTEITITAAPKEGYNFDGWYDGSDKKVSSSPALSFNVTADGTYTAKFVLMPKTVLTVSTVGTGNISINGGEKITNKTEQYSLGTVVTLTAIDSENSPFEYWVDNNGRVVSTSKTYNLYIGCNTAVKAVFNTKKAETHLVTFKNGVSGEIIQKSYAGEGETVTVSANPYMYGYTFDRWDKTDEDIKKAKDDIVITALFKKNEAKCNVSVSIGTINGGAASGQYDIKEFITVTASVPEIGKKFSHWVDSKGTIVCYDATYKFYVTSDIQLTAVYVADESKIEQKASIVLSVIPNQDTKKIAFLTTRIVPEGCTIISHGVILTNNSETAASSENFVLGAAGILKGISKDNRLLGTYIITKGNVASGATWYGRGYLIYKDTNGNVVTVYSSIESGTIN